MTTTSAGNGPSAEDGSGDNDGGWGWFTPAPPATEAEASRRNEQGAQGEQGTHGEQGAQREPAEQARQSETSARRGADNDAPQVGNRPLSPVTTGPGAGRALWAETAEEAAIPVPPPADPSA
ncbi:hypothetical protein AN219_21580, partial [Streptomyces nanshensis]